MTAPTYDWPLALNVPAMRSAHLGVVAEVLETAGDFAEADVRQQNANDSRHLLEGWVRAHVAYDRPDLSDAEVDYRARLLTGRIMSAAYAHVRGEVR
ncbi:hypothetical protein IMZ11_02790 [Microtetraspora sp. AC03309]|uniref:hypothetical protein n=1 Tax=Microtetraspora sp. AC03309 TaxID=2779376 RepID=UPI001E4EA19A|nr:hypothetical protein [Microtetraspora sp. AC03309]MCC5574567.1 hypothetical protein [Microtetraspora sp. AC03309]